MKRIFSCLILSTCLLALNVQAQNRGGDVGFKSIFNEKNLSGWHISRTSHQGTTPKVEIINGAIVMGDLPFGQGGVLLTDKIYSSFELKVEVKLDSFCNSGIFIRSNEGGASYQIELSMPGNTGALYGERISPSKVMYAKELNKVWKVNDWNEFHIKMIGDTPHVTLWVNGVMMWEVQQPKNDFIAGATEGMIGLQCHWTAVFSPAASQGMPLDSWRPNAKVRFRNIRIKPLK
ncbi:MAG: hypothetical protein RL253_1143 [Bacteroidota bacterium]|jgi:hypothetical protein